MVQKITRSELIGTCREINDRCRETAIVSTEESSIEGRQKTVVECTLGSGIVPHEINWLLEQGFIVTRVEDGTMRLVGHQKQ